MRPVALSVFLIVLAPLGAYAAPPDGGPPATQGAPAAPEATAPETAPAPDAGTPEAARLRVEVGHQRVLSVPGLTRAAVGDPAIADVTPTGAGELLVTGLKIGETSLTLWFGARHELRLLEVTAEGRLQEVRDMMAVLGLDALTAKQVGGKVVVQGTVSDVETASRLEQLKKAVPDLVLLTRTDPEVFEEIAGRITDALHEAGLPNAEARAVRGTIFLEGTVADEAEKAKAEKVARAIYEDVVTELSGE